MDMDEFHDTVAAGMAAAKETAMKVEPVKAWPKLKPCPFCGSPARYREYTHYGQTLLYSATCSQGHAESPEMGSTVDAAKWWNLRKRGISPEAE